MTAETADEARRPNAVVRTTPEDFLVEEIPAYLPQGRGEHLYITFTKRGITTPDAIRMLSRSLDVDARGAGFAGMKDRNAVTTQTASFPFPIARDAEAALATLNVPGITVIGAARHDNKLKPGHLRGNRFTIVLREIAPTALAAVHDGLLRIGHTGVPNLFGPQRFGRDGANPDRAIAWIAGRERGPRDRREQRLLFSSLQSLLFNRVLKRREADGTWPCVLPGDLAKKHDTGGLFEVPEAGPELEDAQARAAAGAISATGPMFGAKMRWPTGKPRELEQEIFEAAWGDGSQLETLRHLGEGTRRALRMQVEELSVEAHVGPAAPSAGGDPTGSADQLESTTASRGGARGGELVVRFVLPKGGYATTVLGCVCHLVDASASQGHHDPSVNSTEMPEGGSEDGTDSG